MDLQQERRAVPAGVRPLERNQLFAARHLRPYPCPADLPLVGRDPVPDRFADQFLAGEPEQLALGAIYADHRALRIDLVVRDGGVLKQSAETLLALPRS